MNFPNGLNRTLALFSRAMYDVINSDEIDKVAKNASRKERKVIEVLKDKAKGFAPDQYILWAFVTALNECPHLLIDILAHMVTLDDAVFTGNELADLFATKES